MERDLDSDDHALGCEVDWVQRCSTPICSRELHCSGHGDATRDSDWVPTHGDLHSDFDCTCDCDHEEIEIWYDAALARRPLGEGERAQEFSDWFMASPNADPFGSPFNVWEDGALGRRPSGTGGDQGDATGQGSTAIRHWRTSGQSRIGWAGGRFPEYTGATCALSGRCHTLADCSGHGTTVDLIADDGCECHCYSGWSEFDCSNPPDCEPSHCNNHGTTEDLDNTDGCECSCVWGWHGDNCENPPICTSEQHCNGHGVTSDADATDGCECVCTDFWSGYHCDVPPVCVADMESDRGCYGHGTTTDMDFNDGCDCECTDGWTGVNCDNPPDCYRSDCSGHGITMDLDRTDGCECTCDIDYLGDAWTGDSCEIPPPCDSVKHCSNHGFTTDMDKTDGCECDCVLGYLGDDCHVPPDRTPEGFEGPQGEFLGTNGAWESPPVAPYGTNTYLKYNAPLARQINGFLEVKRGEDWGPVCDDSFDEEDAIVACRMLGFKTVAYWEEDIETYLEIFQYDEADCHGSESNLFDCDNEGPEDEDCSGDEGVLLKCVSDEEVAHATCNEVSWPDVRIEGGVGVTCGPCMVLVDHFDDNYGGSCKTYCESMGRTCVAAFDDYDYNCELDGELSCDGSYSYNQALCQCTDGVIGDAPNPLERGEMYVQASNPCSAETHCSGHGYTRDLDASDGCVCECHEGYWGDNCAIRSCWDGYDCSGHGHAVEPGNSDASNGCNCECEAGWGGGDCNTRVFPMGWVNTEGVVCEGYHKNYKRYGTMEQCRAARTHSVCVYHCGLDEVRAIKSCPVEEQMPSQCGSYVQINEAGEAITWIEDVNFFGVHDGHCNRGWMNKNTVQPSKEHCAIQCDHDYNCFFFAYDHITGTCALYKDQGCPADPSNRYPSFMSYYIRKAPLA